MTKYNKKNGYEKSRGLSGFLFYCFKINDINHNIDSDIDYDIDLRY
jgi:hypothetical protein